MLPLSVYEYSPRVRDADRLGLTSRLEKRWNLRSGFAGHRLVPMPRSDFANSEKPKQPRPRRRRDDSLSSSKAAEEKQSAAGTAFCTPLPSAIGLR